MEVEVDYERDPGQLPPCITQGQSCPKGKMDLNGELDVHPRNWKSFRFWEQLKATHGAITLPEHLRECEVFAENMATIENVVESAKANIARRVRENDEHDESKESESES